MSWASRALLIAALAMPSLAEETVNGRRSVVVEGAKARVVVDMLGGSIVEFRLKPDGLNPLVWANGGAADEARSMSHFLCLDRWGAPSEAELANGVPFHGEATKVAWETLEESGGSARMRARLPMAGMTVEREIRVAPDGGWFAVTETATNDNKLGRVYNMVQHPTVGPPFLDETVVVDSNATRGFMQGGSLPYPEKPSVVWPQALKKDGSEVDMRRLTDSDEPNVVSYIVEEDIGWVTAANPSKGLLIGYVWNTAEYPWLNLWRRLDNGKPQARGLEFGTTGLHQPFPALVEKSRIFGRPILDFLDAVQSKTRSYVAFLAEIGSDFTGVERVERRGDGWVVIQQGGKPINLGELPLK